MSNLEADLKDVVRLPEPLGLGGLAQLADVDRFDLKYPPFVPVVPRALRAETRDGQTIFDVIRQDDVLLHHPYDSFDPVVEFLRTAARDERRAGDQADALPGRPQLAGGRALLRGAAGVPQAGDGAGGAQGALRRGEQHRAGRGCWSARACTWSTAWWA